MTIDAPETVRLPSATVMIGSSMEEVDACVEEWTPRLLDASYTRSVFRSWIAKEFPKHAVRLETFSMGRYPVTNAEYREFVNDASAPRPESLRNGAPADHPVWGVDRDAAAAYTTWLSERTGDVYRLPSEAEWEYAARGPSERVYPFGNRFDARACNTIESGIGTTTPVTRYEEHASEFGIVDLAGNVEEWTLGVYEPYPGGTFIEDDLSRHLGPRYPILRGGSFARGGDLARSARRHGPHWDPVFRFTGFRVVKETSP